MKMKQKRKLEKNPPFKHTCSCSDNETYYMELPEESSCLNSQFFERVEKDKWKDVTHKVEILPF